MASKPTAAEAKATAAFILRHNDPDFWRRVKSKAAAEGVTIKDLILRLLTTWLGKK